MPPMLATIGISTATATTCAMTRFEIADHPRGEERGQQIDAEPDRAPLRRARHRREQILVLVEAGGAHRAVLGLLADDVDDVVDRDAAEQHVVVVDDRRRNPVVVGELLRDFGDRRVRVDRRLLDVHQLVDRRRGIGDQQLRERNAALVLAAAVDDIEMMRLLRQFGALAQVAQHDVDGDVGAHGDEVGIEQAARACPPRSVSMCSRRSRSSRSIDFRTSSATVSGRSPISSARSSMSSVSAAATISSGSIASSRSSRTSSPTWTRISPSSSGSVRPQTIARCVGRQRFEQIADLGRRQRVDQPLDRAEPARADRLGEQAQLAGGLVVAGRFGHRAALERARGLCGPARDAIAVRASVHGAGDARDLGARERLLRDGVDQQEGHARHRPLRRRVLGTLLTAGPGFGFAAGRGRSRLRHTPERDCRHPSVQSR